VRLACLLACLPAILLLLLLLLLRVHSCVRPCIASPTASTSCLLFRVPPPHTHNHNHCRRTPCFSSKAGLKTHKGPCKVRPVGWQPLQGGQGLCHAWAGWRQAATCRKQQGGPSRAAGELQTAARVLVAAAGWPAYRSQLTSALFSVSHLRPGMALTEPSS
jgi:hypothetical protein